MSFQDSSVLQAKAFADRARDRRVASLHVGRLWCANRGTEQIIGLELAGNAELARKGPPGLGWSRLAARRFDGAICRPVTWASTV